MTQLKSIGLCALAALCIWAMASRSLSAADSARMDPRVFGYWKDVDVDSGKTLGVFRLWNDNGKLVGKILKNFPKPGEKEAVSVCTDCAGAQRNKPVAGLIFMWDFKPDNDNAYKWLDGKILNPQDGRVYNAEVELSPDAKTLKLYGYIRILVKIGGTRIWHRTTEAEAR